jgi:3',5'-cyclic AMP phosphodiesterase CpdA
MIILNLSCLNMKNIFSSTKTPGFMKIAHFSDLHLCSKYKRENISRTKKIIKHALDLGAEHFVFSGDISDNAHQNDFLILRKILETYNLFKADKATVVIGNHDIFGGVQTGQDVIKFPSKCVKTDYKGKVQIFFENFAELFENAFFPNDNNPFPFAKVLQDVVLIGINSIDQYSKIKNPFASNGHVTKMQRKNLQSIFDAESFSDKVKIAVIHHHFFKDGNSTASSENGLWNKIESFTMKLRGKKKLIKLFDENKINLVLHGHSHEVAEYERKGIRFVNAGGSIENLIEENQGYYFINIDRKKTKVKFQKYETI